MILTGLLYVFYVVVCVILILVVLLQKGKRADLAGAFGGGGSQTAFGARGAATALTKLTTGAAVTFMVLALTLSIMSSRSAGTASSVLDAVPDAEATEEQLPTAPAELPVVPGEEEAPAIDDAIEDAIDGGTGDAGAAGDGDSSEAETP